MPGVARIDVNGKVTRQILVQIKPNALTALGIGVDQVMNAIRNANQDVPAGRLSRGAERHASCASRARSRTRRSSAGSSSRSRAAGPVYLSQVADVIDGEKEETSLARINGQRVDHASTSRRRRTPTSSRPAAASIAAVEELRKRIPKDVELTVVYNSAESVEKSVNRVKSTILEGAGAHGADRVPVPAQLAQHDHHRPHAADRGDRDVHRAVRVRLLAQLPDADGAVAVHRPADRRRHRGAREHRAPPRAWARTTRRRRARAPTRSASPSWRRRSRSSRCSCPSRS